ncbi:uncharacterized protein JCM15063_003942 [Sporobolomyces koalae]|uniref:uncharacterized protein n=1 Tax=Sporobolomyces koalae TaxID=500713 RepID=UPI00316ECF2C
MASTSTLLETLTRLTTAWDTRRSILSELESSLDSFLTSTPIALSNPTDLLAPDHTGDDGSRNSTSCTQEARSPLHVRPPNEDELQQLLSISFAGLLQVKTDVETLRDTLREDPTTEKLARVVERVEEQESQRIKVTLERDQLRRLSTLQPDLEFSQSIVEKEQLRKELLESIQEEKREIEAEIMDLRAEAAAEEES